MEDAIWDRKGGNVWRITGPVGESPRRGLWHPESGWGICAYRSRLSQKQKRVYHRGYGHEDLFDGDELYIRSGLLPRRHSADGYSAGNADRIAGTGADRFVLAGGLCLLIRVF